MALWMIQLNRWLWKEMADWEVAHSCLELVDCTLKFEPVLAVRQKFLWSAARAWARAPGPGPQPRAPGLGPGPRASGPGSGPRAPGLTFAKLVAGVPPGTGIGQVYFFEDALDKGDNIVTYTFPFKPGEFHEYEINLTFMQQKNTTTGTVRQLLRFPPKSQAAKRGFS